MKQCPSCRSRYTDDTLQFCLQDGTPLAAVYADNETETVISARPAAIAPPSLREDLPLARQPRRRTGLIVFVTMLATMLIFGLATATYFIASRANRNTPAENVNVAVIPANNNIRSMPTPTATITPASNRSNANASPTPNPKDVSREVIKTLADWEADTEALDLDALMTYYADRVDYYRNPGAVRETIKRDKDRAFSRFDSINMEISNIRVSPGKDGNTATAEFDKSWVFEGDSRSEGRVRSRLTFTRVNDKWLISGEQDIKVY